MRNCTALVAVLSAVALLIGCGSDDSRTSDGGNSVNNLTTDATVAEIDSDAAEYDTSADDVASDTSLRRRYDPTLTDLGAPTTTCSTPATHAPEPSAPPRARIFVPSYRIDFGVLSSQAAFREHIHKLVHEKVLPCRSDTAPNVVVFPASMSLPMLLIGDKANSARGLAEATQALTAMIDKVEQGFSYYAEKFPDATIATRFLLALTDPVVRATYDTFGQLADRYDLYISVTVDLPEFQKTTQAAAVSRLGDPDYDAHDYAYEATSPEVNNRQILFGPDGKVVDETLKTYVTAMQLDQLGITPGDFTGVHPMQTPWGRTGVVISKPAWMPDVQARLDDLGAEVIFQPEAHFGGWVTPSVPGAPDASVRWEPDRFLLGGWNLVQRSPRVTHNVVAQLTGNFFELTIDGQVQIIEKATLAPDKSEFVGQYGPLSGNAFIGPWVIEDPGFGEPTLTLGERRDELRRVGQKLRPGSGDSLEGQYVEGMWYFDLHGDAADPTAGSQQPPVQTHPQIATFGNTTYVISSKGTVGERALVVESYTNASRTNTHRQVVSDYDVVRPTIAAADGQLHIVAELIGEDDNRLLYTRFDPARASFDGAGKLLEVSLVGPWAFHPSIAVVDNVLHMSWIKRVGNANRAFYAQTSLDDPFANLAVNAEIEPRPDGRAALQANQWDARVAVDPQAIAATWVDFSNWQWEVMVSVSIDGGLDWSEPLRVDDVPDGVEALNATPTIAALGDGEFLVAWTGARATRPNTRIVTRRLTVAADGSLTPGPVQLLGQTAPMDRWMWRPSLLETATGPAVVYEVLDENSWALEMVSVDAVGSAPAPLTLTGPSQTAKHFAKAHVTATGIEMVYEEVGPDSGTSSRVLLERLER